MILSNQARCKRCNDTPYSANRHDYQSCQCGAIGVDGGMDYMRRVAGDLNNIEDISITIPDDAAKAAIAAIDNARSTGRNALGILCAAAIALRDNGVTLTSLPA